jgi:hypothetical protein
MVSTANGGASFRYIAEREAIQHNRGLAASMCETARCIQEYAKATGVGLDMSDSAQRGGTPMVAPTEEETTGAAGSPSSTTTL